MKFKFLNNFYLFQGLQKYYDTIIKNNKKLSDDD